MVQPDHEGGAQSQPSINVKDKVALVALGILVLTGLFYSLRMIFTPESVISDNFPDLARELYAENGNAKGLGVPSDAIVAVSGSLILIYTLWAGLVLTEGAAGKWTIIHPAMFAFMTIVIANYVGLVVDNARNASDMQQMDAVVGPVVMLLTMLAYFRLRDEGMEDNMTINGKPVTDPHLMSKMLPVFGIVVGSILAINGLMF